MSPGAQRVAGAVLAAGAGSRMGTPKGELVVDGIRLVDSAITVLTDAGCDPVLAVVRGGVEVVGAVTNREPERGLRSSLELAVDAVEAEALVVVLADMPGVDAGSVRQVIEHWSPGRIAMASYPGGSGHPIIMSTSFWRAALELAEPDEGARRFLATNQDLVDLVEVGGSAVDLDSPADLAAWLSRE